MRSTTHTFDVCAATAPYTCACGGCGKTLNRVAKVEHTVNPFNKNDDGSIKTRSEVYRSADLAAREEAAKLEGSVQTCRDCEDAPNRALLLEMAAEPERVFPQPERFWNSPLHVLEDRKHVAAVHEKCACGSDCCSGWKNRHGYRITPAGIKRAASLQQKAAA
jgi:hypothetical protein